MDTGSWSGSTGLTMGAEVRGVGWDREVGKTAKGNVTGFIILPELSFHHV